MRRLEAARLQPQQSVTKRGRKPTPYNGGAWAVGGVVPKAKPRTLPALEARQTIIRTHYLPYATRRATETQDRIYAGLVVHYEHELATLATLIAAQRRAHEPAGEAVRDPLPGEAVSAPDAAPVRVRG